MASTSFRVRSDVSANAIFTPREVKQYRRWQNLHTTLRPNEQGLLPTADEFEDFQQWLRKQDSGYFSDLFEDVAEHIKPATADEPPTAVLCRHIMHPVTAGQLRKRCPVCTIDMYISYTRALEKALRDAGGRAPRAAMQATSPQQEALYAAFVTGKLETLHCLTELEQAAAEEEEWQTHHKDWKNDDVRTAAQALDLYWSEAFAVPPTHTPPPKTSKAVQFAPDTDFTPCRPSHYFHRKSMRYSPGKYTPVTVHHDHDHDHDHEHGDADPDPDADADADHSVSEDSEDYRAPILLEPGPGDIPASHMYDAVQTMGVLTDALRWSEAGVRKAEAALAVGSFESRLGSFESRLEREDDDDDEEGDSDGDSEWEMEDDGTDGSEYIYFEAEEECSFVVFGE